MIMLLKHSGKKNSIKSYKSLNCLIRSATVVVADTGDVAAMEEYKPTDATTNPSLVLAVLKMDEYKSLIEDAAKYAKDSKES